MRHLVEVPVKAEIEPPRIYYRRTHGGHIWFGVLKLRFWFGPRRSTTKYLKARLESRYYSKDIQIRELQNDLYDLVEAHGLPRPDVLDSRSFDVEEMDNSNGRWHGKWEAIRPPTKRKVAKALDVTERMMDD